MITEYKAIKANSIEDLNKKVTDLIQNIRRSGPCDHSLWKPNGGVHTINSEYQNIIYYIQIMVKDDSTVF